MEAKGNVRKIDEIKFWTLRPKVKQMIFRMSFGRYVQKLEANMKIVKKMFRLLIRVIVAIIQIPLTIAYFVIGILGSLLKDAGWLTGMVLFGLALILFIFREFDSTRQMLIMIGVAAGLVIIPEPVTMFLTEGILSIKDFIGSLAEG
jgi:hypothetical protein